MESIRRFSDRPRSPPQRSRAIAGEYDFLAVVRPARVVVDAAGVLEWQQLGRAIAGGVDHVDLLSRALFGADPIEYFLSRRPSDVPADVAASDDALALFRTGRVDKGELVLS